MKRPGLLIARLAIVLGVVGSLAGNTAWAWPHPILVGVGVFMSLVLPTSVALWKATGKRSGWQRAERAAVMGFIALGAATYTFVHAGMLLHDQGLDWTLALIVPLVGESLVVMAARALSPQPVAAHVQHARAPRKPVRGGRSAGKDDNGRRAVVEQRGTHPTPLSSPPPTDDRIAVFDAAQPLLTKGLGWKALRTALGKQGFEVNEYRARQLVTSFRDDRPLHAVNS